MNTSLAKGFQYTEDITNIKSIIYSNIARSEAKTWTNIKMFTLYNAIVRHVNCKFSKKNYELNFFFFFFIQSGFIELVVNMYDIN